jgi:uncharacterized protein with HEPN domain
MCSMRDESLILDDMIAAAERMMRYASGVSARELGAGGEKSDAILFNLAVLGEATKAVPAAIRAAHPEIPWAQMAMTRDKVIHHYHGIDWTTVTDIVENVLPALLPRLEQVREELRH